MATPAALADDQLPATQTTTTGTTTGDLESAEERVAVATVDLDGLRARVARQRSGARYLRRVIGKPRPHIHVVATDFATRADYVAAKLRAWRRKAENAHERYRRPPHRSAWRCIHHHEGPWDDPNAPYYGGLQMDVSFQQQYGRFLLRRKGTADHWRPREQMWVAEQALAAGRGFYPWPSSASRCGLI